MVSRKRCSPECRRGDVEGRNAPMVGDDVEYCPMKHIIQFLVKLFCVTACIVAGTVFAAETRPANKKERLSVKIDERESAFPYLILSPDIEVEVGGKKVLMNYLALVAGSSNESLQKIVDKGYVPANDEQKEAFRAALAERKIGDKITVDRIRQIGKNLGKQTACVPVALVGPKKQ